MVVRLVVSYAEIIIFSYNMFWLSCLSFAFTRSYSPRGRSPRRRSVSPRGRSYSRSPPPYRGREEAPYANGLVILTRKFSY